MKGKRKSKAIDSCVEVPRDLRRHLNALNLKSLTEYKAWCLENGDHGHFEKTRRSQRRGFNNEQPPAVDTLHCRTHSNLDSRQDLLRTICRGEFKKPEVSESVLDRLCTLFNDSCLIQESRRPQRKTLMHLLTFLDRQHTKLFSDSPVIADYGLNDGNSYIEAIMMMAAYRHDWLRPVEQWKPRSHNAWQQFTSLVGHLFVRHDDMPQFFHKVWFARNGMQTAQYRRWYLHVGRGSNIRHCDLPIRFTKKMAQFFMRAPEELSVHEALRWAQVHGLGGDARLARAIFGTHLRDNYEYEEFWETVIGWLAEHPLLNRAQVGPIVDYLHHQRFVPAMIHVGVERNEVAPPAQPNLSMKGRCPDKLLADVTRWHGEINRTQIRQVRMWDHSGILGLDYQADSPPRWTIRELLSNRDLAIEGSILQHCVLSYANACSDGYCSIWTMEVESAVSREKLLTIEVRNDSRTICQIRGFCNRLPKPHEMDIVRLWAYEQGLTVSHYLI